MSPGRKPTAVLDIRRPASRRLAISPVTGSTIKSFDAQAAMRMPGVRAVVEIKPIQPKTLPPSSMPGNVGRTPYALGTEGVGRLHIAEALSYRRLALPR